jgi:hypothetical protein
MIRRFLEITLMGRAIKIFLAHASEDKSRVQLLHKQLISKSFQPWLDEIDLLPGQQWRLEIPKVIRESDIFLACLSKASVQKQGYIQREFRLALDTYAERPPGKTFLIPVKLDACEIPRLQMPELGVDLADFQWLELQRDDGFDRLVKAIKSVIDVYHPPGTEPDRQLPFISCKLEVSPKYPKTYRWKALADVLVELHNPKAIGDVYLIHSGAALQSLRHTETLRRSPQALDQKRAATKKFIEHYRDQVLDGKSFKIRPRRGEYLTVYSSVYDRFLDEFARQQGQQDS